MIAKTLLEAAGVGSYDNHDFSTEAHIGSDYLSAAVVEFTESICECDKQFMVADVIGSVKVLTEGADVTAVTEGIVSSGIEKIKKAWKKLLAKIKEYYRKVVDFFKALLLTGKDFVDRFGKMLQDKAKNAGFTYTGYDYQIGKGDAKVGAIIDAGKSEIAQLVGDSNGFDSAVGLDKTALGKKVGTTAEDKLKLSSDEYEDDFCSRVAKRANLEEVVKEIEELYRDGSSKADGLEMSSAKAKDMCDFISGSKKQISKIESDRDTLTRTINNVIKKLDAIKSDEEGYKAASTVSKYMSKISNVMEKVASVRVALYREITKNFTAVLKALYRFKPTKEEFDPSIDVEMEEGCDQTADEDLKDMEEALQIYLEGDCNEEDDDDDDKDDDDVEESFFAQAARYL